MTSSDHDAALAVLGGLRLESGARWGEVADAHQRADAAAVLDLAGPRRHWLGRSRGYSKTTDVAAMGIGALLTQLRPGAVGYCAAADADQAGLLVAAIRGYVIRTPELAGALVVQQRRVISERTGSVLEVIPADAASAYGLLPALLLVDELCQWRDTSGAREFYVALSTALPKVPDARLVVMSTAGDPAHFSRKIYDQARRSRRWRVSEVHGPAPWQSLEEIEEQRAALMPSMFERLFENRWVASEDRLVDPDDLDAAMVLSGDLPPVRGHRYVIALDLGLRNDASVIVVAHRELDDAGGYRVVVDRLLRWRGSRAAPVQLSGIEAALIGLSREFWGAKVTADPWQASGLVQRLRAAGVAAEEKPFTSSSVGRFAHGLFSALRSRRIHLPDDAELRSELLHVRIRESQPGAYRMDHDSGRHDDQAVAIALAVDALSVTSGQHAAMIFDDGPLVTEARDGTPLMLPFGGKFAIPGTPEERLNAYLRQNPDNPWSQV